MTERWRKKLGDLDGTGPGDDVYSRAHEGPTQPDPQVDLPSTSTKVVTGVAAFLVFALAISVFAIPALRMRNGGPTTAGALQLAALWPARSYDELEVLQSQANEGDEAAIWALDAELAAERFASEVLGWDEAAVAVQLSDSTYTALPANLAYGPSTTYPSGGVSTNGGPLRAVITFVGTNYSGDCDPGPFCPQPITLELYQPLRVGAEGIWAVREVHSPQTSMGQAGSELRNGDSIYAGTRLTSGTNHIPTLAYHVGPGSCDVDFATSEWTEVTDSERWGLVIGRGAGLVLPVEHGCTEATPGYVWLATADRSLIADDESAHVVDPFTEGGLRLGSLTAVPVVFVPPAPSGSFSELPPTVGAPTIETPTPPPGGWTVYRADPAFGWTIEWPTGLEARHVDDGVSLPIGDGVFVDILRLAGAPPADDSSFPLDPSDLDGSLTEFTFRGDGQAFEWFVASEAGGNLELGPGQRATLERMVSSIRFAPWDEFERRGEWFSYRDVGSYEGDGRFEQTGDGVSIFIRRTEGEILALDGINWCDSPPTLRDGLIATRCDGGYYVTWTFDGEPVDSAPPGFGPGLFDQPLTKEAVVISHDGHILVQHFDEE